MKETIKIIMMGLNRYFLKRRIRKLLRHLPGDMQSAVMHDLLEIIDIPDRRERVRKIREIFRPFKEQLESPYEQKVSDCRKEYSEMLDKTAANVIAPDFPMACISINHDSLEQKAKAKLTLQSLEDELMDLPYINYFHLFAAFLCVLLSTVANFMTISAKFGNDWMGGSDLVTGICNGFFSLLLNVFEAIGLYLLLHFMPKRYGKGFARLLGIIGALVLVISICITIFARTEIGTSAMTSVQDAGKVE